MKLKNNQKTELLSRLSHLSYEGDDIKNGIARWGKYNDLPDKRLNLLKDEEKTSVWHIQAVKTVVRYIQADGFALESGNDLNQLLREANSFGETLNNILEKVAWDFKVLGSFALEIIWDNATVAGLNSEKRIAEIYHIPMKDVRAKEKNYRGLVEGYYICPKWKKKRYNADLDKDPDVQFLPTFNPSLASYSEDGNQEPQPKQILVVSNYNPNSQYYSEPDYQGGLIEILTDSMVSNFQISHLSSAIVASQIISIPGDYSDDEWSDILDNLSEFNQGAQNGGEPLVVNPKTASETISVTTPTGQSDSSGVYGDYKEDLMQRIFSIHGLNFSEIAGVTSTGTGLSREQIMEKFVVFMNTTIRDFQMPLLSGFNKLMTYILPSESLVINPINLFDGLEAPQADVTGDDEDTGLTEIK